MHLYIVRHTQVAVPKGTCYGITDIGLADSFLLESEIICERLKGISFNYFFSSPLSRCRKLSNVLKENLELSEINIDKRLVEMNFGDWETKIWSDIEKTKYAKKWFADFVNIPCPNGESYVQLIDRVKSFLKDINKLESNGNILIVTHGGIVKAINVIIKKWNPQNAFDLEVDYGQIVKLELK